METLNNEHPETLEEKAPYFLVDIWNEGKKNTLMPRGQVQHAIYFIWNCCCSIGPGLLTRNGICENYVIGH